MGVFFTGNFHTLTDRRNVISEGPSDESDFFLAKNPLGSI